MTTLFSSTRQSLLPRRRPLWLASPPLADVSSLDGVAAPRRLLLFGWSRRRCLLFGWSAAPRRRVLFGWRSRPSPTSPLRMESPPPRRCLLFGWSRRPPPTCPLWV